MVILSLALLLFILFLKLLSFRLILVQVSVSKALSLENAFCPIEKDLFSFASFGLCLCPIHCLCHQLFTGFLNEPSYYLSDHHWIHLIHFTKVLDQIKPGWILLWLRLYIFCYCWLETTCLFLFKILLIIFRLVSLMDCSSLTFSCRLRFFQLFSFI